MTPIRALWLALAIGGAVVPWLSFAPFLMETGGDMAPMIAAWNANLATTGLLHDIGWTFLALALWILVESLPRRDWLSLLAIPAGPLIGVSCALPLYLFLRTRPGTTR